MASIPVYSVAVPEYALKRYRRPSHSVQQQITPWYGVPIPKIYVDNKPDFRRIGTKIDVCFKKHFLGKSVVVRCLGSQEHHSKSVDEIIALIKKLGHDRYDPKRKGDRYENLEKRHIDFFALPFKVKEKGRYFERFIEPFYFWPVADRGSPVRIDIAIIYDRSKLTMVSYHYEGRENEHMKDGFIFKHPGNKPDAILGIIRIS